MGDSWSKVFYEIKNVCWTFCPALIFFDLIFLGYVTFEQDTTTEKNSPIIGVIGPASSEEVVLVQTLLKIFRIPEVGYSATSAELSEKRTFGYFVRVVPSDRFQASVILEILQKYNWTYVNVVNTAGIEHHISLR